MAKVRSSASLDTGQKTKERITMRVDMGLLAYFTRETEERGLTYGRTGLMTDAMRAGAYYLDQLVVPIKEMFEADGTIYQKYTDKYRDGKVHTSYIDGTPLTALDLGYSEFIREAIIEKMERTKPGWGDKAAAVFAQEGGR